MRNCKVCSTAFDGRRCPECHRRINRENRLKNPERVKAYAKAYQEANKDAISAYRKEYAAANPEKIRQQKAAFAAKNSEKIVAKVGEWRRANPDAKRVQSHNYRARKTGKGRLSRGLSQRLMAEQQGFCACCFRRLEDEGYNMDHIIPLAKGGLNVDSNIQLLAPICNGRKHAKMPEVYAAQYGDENALV